MANLTAEEFLAQVKLAAEANDMELDALEFTTASGLRCSWYPMPEDDHEAMWHSEASETRQ